MRKAPIPPVGLANSYLRSKFCWRRMQFDQLKRTTSSRFSAAWALAALAASASVPSAGWGRHRRRERRQYTGRILKGTKPADLPLPCQTTPSGACFACRRWRLAATTINIREAHHGDDQPTCFVAATAASVTAPAIARAKECPAAGMDWMNMSLQARNSGLQQWGACRARLRADKNRKLDCRFEGSTRAAFKTPRSALCSRRADEVGPLSCQRS